MPVLAAPMKPNGLPTAITNSPARSVFESPTAPAGSPLASMRTIARSRRRSVRTMLPGKRRPSQSSTSTAPDLRAPSTTCALVTMLPSGDQMTPDPPPWRCAVIWTVTRRSFSTISPKGAPTLLPPAAGPLSDAHIQILHRARPQHLELDGLARRCPLQKVGQRFGLRQRLAIATHQNIPQDQSSNGARPFGLDSQQHNAAILFQALLHLARQRHRLQRHSQKPSADVALLAQFSRDSIDGAARHCEDGAARESGGNHTDQIAAGVQSRAA